MPFSNPFIEVLQAGANASANTMRTALGFMQNASNLFNSSGSLALKMNALLEQEEAQKQKQLLDQAEYLRQLQKDEFEEKMRKREYELNKQKAEEQAKHWGNQDIIQAKKLNIQAKRANLDEKRYALDKRKYALDERRYALNEDKFKYDIFKDSSKEERLDIAAKDIAKRFNISTTEARALLENNPNALEYKTEKDPYGNIHIYNPYTGEMRTLLSIDSMSADNNIQALPLKKQIEMLDIQIQAEKNPKIKQQLLIQKNNLEEKYKQNQKHYDTEYNVWKTINIVLPKTDSASQIAFNTQGSIFKWFFGGEGKVKENLIKLSTKYPVAVKGLNIVSNMIDDNLLGEHSLQDKIDEGVNMISKKFFGKSIPMVELKKRLWKIVKDEFGANIVMLDKKSINALKQYDPNLGSLYDQYIKEKDEKKKNILKQKITQHEQKIIPTLLNAYGNLIKDATKKAFIAGKINENDDENTIIAKALEYAVGHPQEFGNSTQEDIINFIAISNGLLLDFIGNGKVNFK